jgi:hypothetical protein
VVHPKMWVECIKLKTAINAYLPEREDLGSPALPRGASRRAILSFGALDRPLFNTDSSELRVGHTVPNPEAICLTSECLSISGGQARPCEEHGCGRVYRRRGVPGRRTTAKLSFLSKRRSSPLEADPFGTGR